MMTPTRPGRDPYVLLLAALTYHERNALHASLNSAWAKQAAVYSSKSPIYQDTYELLGDVNEAPARAAAYLESATVTCRTCGANGADVELEKITARPVGGGSTRTEWLCADRLACTARKFPQLADTLAALTARKTPDGDDPGEAGERPFTAVPRLRRVRCTRTVVTDGSAEQCGLPVDHDPDEKCPGNPHARPAPPASQS